MDETNFPNGENHLLPRLKKQDLNYFSLKRLVPFNQIGQTYHCDKKLAFLDSKGDKLVIDNQEILQFAIFTSVQAAFEEYLRTLQVLNKSVPNPLVLTTVELKFLVSGTLFSFTTGRPYSDQGRSFLNKEKLLKELVSVSRVSYAELNAFYEDFNRVSNHKGTNQGRLFCSEFVEALK